MKRLKLQKILALGLCLAMTLQPISAAAAYEEQTEASVSVLEGTEEEVPGEETEEEKGEEAPPEEPDKEAAEEEAAEAESASAAEAVLESSDAAEPVEEAAEASEEENGQEPAEEELLQLSPAAEGDLGGIAIEGLPEGADPVIAVGATVRMVMDGVSHWESSDPAIAAVSYTGGVVTAIKAGKVSINAYESDALVGSVELTVTKKMSTFKLDKTYLELASADSDTTGTSFSRQERLTVTINPADVKNALIGGMYFESSDADVATVSEDGLIEAQSVGTALITCHAGGMSVSCDVVVVKPMESIDLYIAGNDSFGGDSGIYKLALNKGEEELLRVSYYPEDTTEQKKVTWSTDNKGIATVTADGVVKGIKKGSCTIRAKWVSPSDKKRFHEKVVSVDVTAPLEQIKILNSKKKEVSLIYLNKSAEKATPEQLYATLVPADISGLKKVEWGSSNEEVATVSSNGVVTPLKKGFTTITATCQDVESYCVVKVTQNLKGLVLDNRNITLAMGQSLNLEEYVSPDPADCSDPWVLTWKTANKAIVNVEDGVITGVKAGGPVKITVSCGKITNYFSVTVKRVTVGGLIVDTTALELEKGGASKDIVVTADPNATVSYTMDRDDLVTVNLKEDAVDVYQIVPAMNGKAGIVKITFTATYTVQRYNGTGVQKTKSVKVIAKVKDPVKTVYITDKAGDNLTSLALECGDTFALWSSYLPEGATDVDGVTWKSSKTGVCTVDKNGILKAKGNGDCQISAKIGGVTAFLPVTVVRPLLGIRLNKTSLSLKQNGTAKLSVSFNPSNASVDKGIDWTSSDTSICTVDNGTVRAITGGVAVITATSQYDPDFSASCVVNVSVPLTKLTITRSGSQTMLVGDEQELTMGYDPEDTTFKLEDVTAGLEGAALEKVLPKWEPVNNKVISIEPSDDHSTCTITALAKGTATVKVTYQKKSATMKITVN